jgi:hypothetical protein
MVNDWNYYDYIVCRWEGVECGHMIRTSTPDSKCRVWMACTVLIGTWRLQSFSLD